ncbi:hypothetical protein B296_00014398 [Ensete ventricosum]|uniref:Uncharacterized protein n=1 Tax=Ensete ventricosum TaxID=4639 RepID=A0A427AGE2_ENSVE|nr:hypothetical protein B296_00014398 [Ensete ventricosum]
MRPCKVGWVAQQLKRVVQSSQRCDPRMGGRRWSKGVRKRRRVQRGLAPQNLSVGQNGGGRLEECHSAVEVDLPIAKKGT